VLLIKALDNSQDFSDRATRVQLATELNATSSFVRLAARPVVTPLRPGRVAAVAGTWLMLTGNTVAIVWLWLHGGGIRSRLLLKRSAAQQLLIDARSRSSVRRAM
jgi:hypothetical protein